jgi:hypothetical protein
MSSINACSKCSPPALAVLVVISRSNSNHLWWRRLWRYIAPMERPTDFQDKRTSYWIRGPRTRRHIYFYPSDDRAGFALPINALSWVAGASIS